MKVTRRTGSLVIVLVIFAAIVLGTALAAIAIDKSEIPMLQQHAAEAAAVAAVGSDIGRDQTGSNIIKINQTDDKTAAQKFYYAIHPNNHNDSSTCNNVISLERDITFNSSVINGMNAPWNDSTLTDGDAPSTIFYATGFFAGTIYGNGHTVTIVGPETDHALHQKGESNPSFGGIAAKLSGKIYDLNVEISNYIQYSGANENGEQNISMGGLVGSLVGGTIDNCTVTYTNNVRLAAMSNSRSNDPKPTVGGLVGKFSSGTISNCTVNILNGAWIESGIANGAGEIVDTYNYGYAGAVVGRYDTDGTKTLNNITVTGTGNIKSIYSVSVLGAIEGGNVIVNNLYVSATISFHDAGTQNALFTGTGGTINNYFYTYNAPTTNISWPSARAEVNTSSGSGYTIQFDPTIGDYSNSLAITFTNQSALDANKMYCVTSGSGEKFFSGIYEDGKAIFRNIKTSANTWKNSSNQFTATLSRITVEKLPALTKYEHGYVSEDYVSEAIEGGTAINNGTEFEKLFKPNGTADENGKYYLTDDIFIKGFTGKSFSGTLDGNGHTVYILADNKGLDAGNVGGLVGDLSNGTIKNLRLVIAADVSVLAGATTDGNATAVGIGAIAGRITGSGNVENVNVVIPAQVDFRSAWTEGDKGADRALGGIAGEIFGSGGHIKNCTVEINGSISAVSRWPFVGGFVGITEQLTSASSFKNIILKGSGKIGGVAYNNSQPTFAAAITTVQPKTSTASFSIDGFIYAMKGTPYVPGSVSGSVSNGVSSFGYVAHNDDSGNAGASINGGTDGKVTIPGSGTSFTYQNLFVSGVEDVPTYHYGTSDKDGNKPYPLTTAGKIEGTVSSSETGTISDISVNAYFRPGSDGNITLVASGTGVSSLEGVLKERGESLKLAVEDGENLVLDIAKSVVTGTEDTIIGLQQIRDFLKISTAPWSQAQFTYTGLPQSRVVSIINSDGEEFEGDYTITFDVADASSTLSNGVAVNAGSYYIKNVEIDENSDYYFIISADDGSNTLSKSYTYASADEKINKFVINPAEVELAFVSDSMTVTYDAEAVEENPEVSVSGDTFGLDDLGELTYVWMNADGTETLSANPKDAGSYQVKISAVANPNFTVGGAAASGNTFTIKPATVELSVEGANTFTFAQDTGAITSANVNANDTYGLTINGFIDSDTNAAYTVSLASPVYIEENGTSNAYLAAGEYNLTVTLSSPNYTFGTTSGENTDTVTVNVGQGANSVSAEYSRDNWVYYNTPSAENFQMRFGTPTFRYTNVRTGEGFDSLTSTSPVGTYNVTVTVAETTSYSAFGQTFSGVFEITALPVSITLTAQDAVYSAKQYAESNITVSLDGSYTATDDVAAILGEITYKHKLASATELGNMTAGNISVSDLDAITADLVINKKTVAFNAVEADKAALYYGQNISDFSSLVSVTHEDMTGYDFEKADWRYSVTSDFTSNTEANTPVTLTVKIFVDDPNYSVAEGDGEFVLNNIKVSKADIVIEVNISDKEYDGGELEATATETSVVTGDATGSDITIIYYKVNTAETGEGRYTKLDSEPINAGTYAVRATVAGQDNYNAAQTEYIEFTISKAEQPVTVSIDDDWTYGGEASNKVSIKGIQEDADTTVRYSGTTNAGTEYSSKTVPTEAGTYTVTVSWVETTNYTAGSCESAKFTIERAEGKADITITYSVGDVTGATYTPGKTMLYYNGSAYTFKVDVEYFDGGKLTTEINGNPRDNLTAANAGTYTVTATVSESPNYFGADSETSIVINKAVISGVSVVTSSFVFGVEDGGLTTENANVGTTYGTTTPTFALNSGDGTPGFTYSLDYGTKYETSNDGVNYINAGTYTLTFGLNEESKTNFEFVEGGCSAIITVDTGSNEFTTITKSAGWIFGLTSNTSSAASKFGDVVIKTVNEDGNEVKISNALNAGTYTDTFTVSTSEYGNYDEIFYDYTFVVEKHSLEISGLTIFGNGEELEPTTDGFTVTYAPEMSLSATVKVISGEDGFNASLDGLIGEKGSYKYFFEYSAEDSDEWFDDLPQKAGKYTVRFKGMKLAEKYNIDNFKFVSVPSVKLTIDPAEITVTAGIPENSVVYGMTANEIRNLITLTPKEGVTLDTVTVTCVDGTAYDNTVDAETKLTISVSVKAENENYIAKFADGNTSTKLYATVQKAKLTVTADAASSLRHDVDSYNEPADFYQYIVIDGATPLKNGHTVQDLFTITLPELFDDNESEFKIMFSVNEAFEGRGNYVFTDDSVWVIILTLSTDSYTLEVNITGWTFGEEAKNPKISGAPMSLEHGVQFSYTGETYNGEQYDSPAAPTEAGTYKVKATIAATSDYTEGVAEAAFTIAKRPIALALSSDSASAHYDRRVAITDFTSVFGEYFVADDNSYAGGHALKDVFKLTASSNSGVVTEIKNAGSYKITAELRNDNYDWATDASSPEFTYTIVKAIVKGFKVEIGNWIYGEPGSVPEFSGLIDDMTTGEGYEVTYSYSGEDNSGNVYNSSSEQPTDAGKYTVTATYPGNANYESATATCDFIIDRADLDKFAVSAPDNLAYTGQPLSDEIPVVEGTRGDYTVVYKNSDGEKIERSAIIAAGTYTAIVTALGTANYNKAEKQCQIIIAPARVSVTVSSSNEISFGVLKTDQVNGVYDTDGLKGYDFGVNITSQTSLSESADPLYYTYVIVSSLGGEVAGEEGFINVGSYKVVIELSSDNYIFTDTDEHTTDFAFEILTVENTITGDFRKDWTYGNDPSGVTADAKYGSVVIKTVDKGGNEVVVSNALHAGTYTDIFTVPASEYGNYGEITVTKEFTISPRALSWNWSDEIGDEIVFGTTSEELEGKVATEISGWFNGDSEYASVAFTFTVDGAAYNELVNAGSEVTLTLSFEWAEGAPEKLKGSYSVTDPESYEKSFEVISKSVTLTKEDFNEVYGSAYDPSTPLADYFANRFFYEDTAIGEAFDEYTVCEYSINGDGKAEDRLNAGTYTVTVSVSGNYSAEAWLTYTVDKKTISLSDEASVTEEYGVLTPDKLTSVIDPAKLFDGLEFEDKFSEGDFTTSASDYSENVEDGFLTVGQYFVDVALTDKAVNYTAPEEGLGSVVIYVTEAGNYIDSYYPDDWTYLDNLTEYLPEIPGAKFGKVQSAFFAPDGTEMDLNDFSAETPAGTYSYEFTVSGTDNYASATLKGKFSVKVRNVFVTLNAPGTIFDGAAYDQLTYTLSDDKVTEYVGEITFGYSSGGSSYTEGFPVNAGSYIIKLLNYSDSENINLLSEPVSVVISPAPMNFTVTGAAYASVEYGTDPDEIDLDALIASVVPDSDIGSFTYTVNLLTANGREYTDSTYAGTVLYACVEITVTNGNFYAVVPEEVEDFPAVNVVRKAHDISLEIDDEIVTDGNEITVAEGVNVNLIDAIASYMSKNGVKFYDYVVTVDGERYNRDMVWTPGEHEVIVSLSGNHEGEASFTVMVEESLEPAKEPFVPATKVGEVLESINFTWASAVSIGFGVAVAVLIILFFGLRRSKKK